MKSSYYDLKESLRASLGVHIDETSYKVVSPDSQGGNYAWSMSSIEKDNYNTVFALGKNRGKGNATCLLGENYNGIGVSDDYPAYTNTFKLGKHALCWAHPHRKFRDLKNSSSLEESKKEACKVFYDKFSKLYSELIEANTTLNQNRAKLEEREVVRNRLETKLRKILAVDKFNKDEPTKLRTLKATMLKKIDRYLVCIKEEDVPTTNNKAERSLRHLVIKRKKSFGSKTAKGAQIMSILYSVVMSLWWKSKKDFFKNYEEVVS